MKEYTDATIVGRMPIGLHNGVVIPDTVQCSRNSFRHHLEETIEQNGLVRTGIDVLRTRVPVRTDRYDLVFPLVCTNGYYHWMVEYLPRVRALRAYERATGRRPTVLVRQDPPLWMVETLEAVGIEEGRYREWDGRVAEVQRLVTCTHHTHYTENFNPNPPAYEWVKNKLLATADSSFTTSDRVYISRADAATRRVHNEAELVERLADLGFERYVLTDLTLAEQIQLFRKAETVVGPHGAGFVNMIFGDSLSVVELFPETMIEPYYYLLANILGHDYDCRVEDEIGQMKDTVVDVDKTVRMVDAASVLS